LGQTCENSFAQIEVQLKRRYDLIPMLVECVRGFLAHERDVLERVIAARNDAAAGLAAAGQPNDTAAFEAWQGAEGALAGALGRLTVIMEAYPSLVSNERVAELTEELTSTENRIAFARQAYNDYVSVFNSYRQSFPICVLAAVFGFASDRQLLTYDKSANLDLAPQVTLSS
jgi:LemA protein